MILFAGQLYPTSEQQRLIDELEDRINATLSGDGLSPRRDLRSISGKSGTSPDCSAGTI